jgi:hypothetical protein
MKSNQIIFWEFTSIYKSREESLFANSRFNASNAECKCRQNKAKDPSSDQFSPENINKNFDTVAGEVFGNYGLKYGAPYRHEREIKQN